MPIDGGQPVQVTKEITSLATISPDGSLIAVAYFLLDKPQSPAKIAVYRFEGGDPVRIFDRPSGSDDKVAWSSDGKNLEYIVTRGGASNIWRQPLAGGPPFPVTHGFVRRDRRGGAVGGARSSRSFQIECPLPKRRRDS